MFALSGAAPTQRSVFAYISDSFIAQGALKTSTEMSLRRMIMLLIRVRLLVEISVHSMTMLLPNMVTLIWLLRRSMTIS
jgi:hypothetical protein